MNVVAEFLRSERLHVPGRILKDAERELILFALKKFCGHHRKSAAWLGMGARTIGMKIDKYGLHDEWFRSRTRAAPPAPPAPPPYIDQIMALLKSAQSTLGLDEYNRLVDLTTLVLHDEQTRLHNLLHPSEVAA